MRFYGMDDRTVGSMTLSRFWLLSSNIDRIRAEEDIRLAQLFMAANADGEGRQKFFSDLQKQMGKVIVVDDGQLALTRATRDDRDTIMSLNRLGRAV